MSIEFSPEIKEEIASKLVDFMESELKVEIGQFDGIFLMDFIAKNIGNYYYNQGVQDAHALLDSKLDILKEGVYELEKPVDY